MASYLFIIGLSCRTIYAIDNGSIFSGKATMCERALYVFLGKNGMLDLSKSYQRADLRDRNSQDNKTDIEDSPANEEQVERDKKYEVTELRYSNTREQEAKIGWLYAGSKSKATEKWVTCNIYLNDNDIKAGEINHANKPINIRNRSPYIVDGKYRKGLIISSIDQDDSFAIIDIDTIPGIGNKELIWIKAEIYPTTSAQIY